ncbi:MAG: hypothetical protein F6K09_11025 [Merismopedia sp. SIO2A8]|nr:hypothetical protein [Merismopedia sp. SIO2A8]
MRLATTILGLLGSVLVINLTAEVGSAETIHKGSLELGDAIFFYDGSLYDDYPIQGQSGQTIAVELQSSEFDPFLAIVGSDGAWLAQNDDINEDNNNAALSFTFPESDTYYIFVNTYKVNGQGTYTLILSPETLDSTNGTPVEIPLVLDSPPMPPPILIQPSYPVETDETETLSTRGATLGG